MPQWGSVQKRAVEGSEGMAVGRLMDRIILNGKERERKDESPKV